jgi:uncharacterized heparinase superfamily protein
MNAARLLRTVSHLRASQVWHRARLTGRRALWSRLGARIDARYARAAARLPALPWDHPGLARFAAERVARRDPKDALRVARNALAGRFSLLGETRALGQPVVWHGPALDAAKLWKTQLHEFPFALDLAIACRETGDPAFRDGLFALAHGWSRASPIGVPGFHAVAWNERVVATRLMNWAAAGAWIGPGGDPADAAWLGRAIGLHALFLRDNLAWDLLANHLFRDFAALFFAHTLVGGLPEAEPGLAAQVAEQVLPDGCHVERCPMYHAVCLMDLLDLRALLGVGAPAWLTDAVARMAGFLEHVLHGDGDLPLFGDGWLGEVEPTRLLAQARAAGPLRPPVQPERGSGLVALRCGEVRAVVRAGAHGPDYQPGHAHADLLSFELSRGRHRIVTDTGTGIYQAGPARDRLRSTSAHNTIQIDGEELLEVWGSFRAGRRGRASTHGRGAGAGFEWLWASHDAYHWVPGSPHPHRLLLVSAREVLVLDAVLGRGRHRIASRLHLHPDAPAGEATALALGAEAQGGPAPLHAHFGETREMEERAVELEVELPWLGGWWLPLGVAARPSAALSLEGSLARLRLGREAGELEVRWELGASGPGAVDVRELAPRQR